MTNADASSAVSLLLIKPLSSPLVKQLRQLLIGPVVRACTAAFFVTAVSGSSSVLAMQVQDGPADGSARMTLLACGGGGSGTYRKPAKPGAEEEGHS